MARLQTRRAFVIESAAAIGASLGVVGTSSLRGGPEPAKVFRPKYAICNETFEDWPFDKAFGVAAECGYQGIEVAPFTISNDVTDISAKRRAKVRGQAEKEGLRIVGLHWLLARTKGFHLTSADRDVRRKTAGYLGALARFCADLGGNMLIFGSPQQRNLAPGVSREKGLEYAAEVIRELLPALEKTKVNLALEPLGPKTTNFLRTAAEAVELVELVDSPRCQVNLDCNAMDSESKSIPELIRETRSHLTHFHANDPNRRGPGFGELDFVPIFKALKDIDYRGWVSVEVFDYKPGAERLARESIQYMRKCAELVSG